MFIIKASFRKVNPFAEVRSEICEKSIAVGDYWGVAGKCDEGVKADLIKPCKSDMEIVYKEHPSVIGYRAIIF